MAKTLRADDILPLVESLTPRESIRLLRLIALPQGADAPEFSVDYGPLAWDAEGWENVEWESEVSRYEVIGASRLGAFRKKVVIGIETCMDLFCPNDITKICADGPRDWSNAETIILVSRTTPIICPIATRAHAVLAVPLQFQRRFLPLIADADRLPGCLPRISEAIQAPNPVAALGERIPRPKDLGLAP
jgi:hypothetical protein